MAYKDETKEMRTAEDWYPTVNGKVRVRTMKLTDGRFRVCLWGGDDFGLEQDFTDATEARKIYRGIQDFTTQRQLKQQGFQNA